MNPGFPGRIHKTNKWPLGLWTFSKSCPCSFTHLKLKADYCLVLLTSLAFTGFSLLQCDREQTLNKQLNLDMNIWFYSPGHQSLHVCTNHLFLCTDLLTSKVLKHDKKTEKDTHLRDEQLNALTQSEQLCGQRPLKACWCCPSPVSRGFPASPLRRVLAAQS